MSINNENVTMRSKIVAIYRLAIILALIWTIIISASAGWSVFNERKKVDYLAKNEARVNFKKDQAFRMWGTKHGGVYVPATNETPPNKYLAHIPERNIITPSGTQLTLMNPAYMIRQITEDFEQFYGISGKITSLKVLNPINEPDAWEVKALKLFESGIEEVMEYDTINDKPHLRLMRPMYTKKGCLKCHGFQGYQVGDVRGAVNVAVPLEPYHAMMRDELFIVFLTHGGIWGLGLIGIVLVTFRSKKRNIESWKLEEEKTRFGNILNESYNEIYIFDTETLAIAYANKCAQESLGYTTDELKGKRFFDIQTDYDINRFRELVKPLLSGKIKTVTFETNNIKKDTKIYPVEVHIQLIHSEEEIVLVAIVLDITEQKEAGEIKKSYGQLVHAEKLAALGKLTGSIAHEFNNPLYGVTSILEQIEEDSVLDGRYNELLGLAIKECERMSNLVVKLRDFYRPSTGELVEIDVHQIIEDMLLLMDKKLMKRKISVKREYSQEIIRIKNVEDKVKQVILNVIQNAEESIVVDTGGTICISTEISDRKVYVKIRDTGGGISDEDLQNIFTPFFTTKGHKGTGLGLSVCYGIIKECGGDISVESETGKGTCFSIELPLKGICHE